MFRVLEGIGVVAPAIGIVILILYRKRAGSALGVALLGAAVAATASVIGLIAPRLALLGTAAGSETTMLSGLHSWAVVRTALLVLGVALLIVGALNGRRGARAPWPLIGVGIAVAAIGFAIGFVPVDLGAEHEGLTELLGFLVETVHFAIVGVGVLVLCLAVVSGRAATDGRRQPAELLQEKLLQAKHLYDRSRAYRR